MRIIRTPILIQFHMKFSLVFDQSGDSIEFNVINNHEIFEYFVTQSVKNTCNSFSDDSVIGDTVTKLLNELHNSLSLTNTLSQKLCGIKFHENHDRFYGKTPRFPCLPLLVWEKEERKTGDF